jgi:hypothetical protein
MNGGKCGGRCGTKGRGGGRVVVVVVGCKIGGMEREVRVGTRIWVKARTLTRPQIKTLIFGDVSLNKFEISRGYAT